MYIVVKIITPILSAVVFSLFLASGIIKFSTVLWISLPVFIVIGTLFSVSIEYFLDKKKLDNLFYKYFLSFIFYGVAGILTITLILVIQGSISGITIPSVLILGAVPGLIYFHINLLLTTLLKRLSFFN